MPTPNDQVILVITTFKESTTASAQANVSNIIAQSDSTPKFLTSNLNQSNLTVTNVKGPEIVVYPSTVNLIASVEKESTIIVATPVGQQGIQGPVGPIGPTGAASTVPGPMGPTGATGAQGIQGPTGAQGIQGIQGPTGATGPQGPIGISGSGVAGNNDIGVMYLKGNTFATTIPFINAREIVAGGITTGVLYNFQKHATTNSLQYIGTGGRFHVIATFDFETEVSNNTCGFYVGVNRDIASGLSANGDRISESEVYIHSSNSSKPVAGALQTIVDLNTNDRLFFIVQNKDAAKYILVEFLKFIAVPLTSERGATGATGQQGIQGIQGPTGPTGAISGTYVTSIKGAYGTVTAKGVTNEIEITTRGTSELEFGLSKNVTISGNLDVLGNINILGTLNVDGFVISKSGFQGYTGNSTLETIEYVQLDGGEY